MSPVLVALILGGFVLAFVLGLHVGLKHGKLLADRATEEMFDEMFSHLPGYPGSPSSAEPAQYGQGAADADALGRV